MNFHENAETVMLNVIHFANSFVKKWFSTQLVFNCAFAEND